MIVIENTEVVGWEAAIRGMRNPMNSWEASDTKFNVGYPPRIGEADAKLMRQLALAGTDHSKYRRMIMVYADITAPLYWWKEYDTYKVGTVTNSCSTMHKIHEKEFTAQDFSVDYLFNSRSKHVVWGEPIPVSVLQHTIMTLNVYREKYLNCTKQIQNEFDERVREALVEIRKTYWWQMIQLLPSSYNQKRTVMLSYETLANMHDGRDKHKLDEWLTFCDWIDKDLPYSWIINPSRVKHMI